MIYHFFQKEVQILLLYQIMPNLVQTSQFHSVVGVEIKLGNEYIFDIYANYQKIAISHFCVSYITACKKPSTGAITNSSTNELIPDHF